MKTLKEILEDELIKRFGRKLKVDVDLNTKPDTWKLNRIERQPGSVDGSGGKVMQAISKIADKSKKKVELIPLERQRFGNQLKNYYKQFGYRQDYERPYKMIRNPQIKESKVEKVEVFKGKEFPVYVNPDKGTLKGLYNTNIQHYRAIQHDNSHYLWDANVSDHFNTAHKLGLKYKECTISHFHPSELPKYDYDIKQVHQKHQIKAMKEDMLTFKQFILESTKDQAHDINVKDLKDIAKDADGHEARYIIKDNGSLHAGPSRKVLHSDLAGNPVGILRDIHTYGYVNHHPETGEYSHISYVNEKEKGRRYLVQPQPIFHDIVKNEFPKYGIQDYESTKYYAKQLEEFQKNKLKEQYLTEKNWEDIPAFYPTDPDVRVYTNPNKSQMKDLIGRTGNYIRSLHNSKTDKLHVWNAYDAIHQDIRTHFELGYAGVTSGCYHKNHLKTKTARELHFNNPAVI